MIYIRKQKKARSLPNVFKIFILTRLGYNIPTHTKLNKVKRVFKKIKTTPKPRFNLLGWKRILLNKTKPQKRKKFVQKKRKKFKLKLIRRLKHGLFSLLTKRILIKKDMFNLASQFFRQRKKIFTHKKFQYFKLFNVFFNFNSRLTKRYRRRFRNRRVIFLLNRANSSRMKYRIRRKGVFNKNKFIKSYHMIYIKYVGINARS